MRGRRRELYCFRDEQGLEVDFVALCDSINLVAGAAKRRATNGRNGDLYLFERATDQNVLVSHALGRG